MVREGEFGITVDHDVACVLVAQALTLAHPHQGQDPTPRPKPLHASGVEPRSDRKRRPIYSHTKLCLKHDGAAFGSDGLASHEI